MTTWTPISQSTSWIGTNVYTFYNDPLTDYNQSEVAYGGTTVWMPLDVSTNWSKP